MCVTDCHDITLAVKVALNPNTTNQGNSIPWFRRLLDLVDFMDPQLCNDSLRIIYYYEHSFKTVAFDRSGTCLFHVEKVGKDLQDHYWIRACQNACHIGVIGRYTLWRLPYTSEAKTKVLIHQHF